jgi:hypothetical protein
MTQLAVQIFMQPTWCYKYPGLPPNRLNNLWDIKTNLTVSPGFRKRNSLSFGEDMRDDDLQLAVDRFIGVDDKVSKWGEVLDVDMFTGEDVILKCGSRNWIISSKIV